jgi:alpha-galactosidase
MVQIGVGEHTPHTLVSAYLDPHAHVEALGFVDINEERLEAVAATCRALNELTGKQVAVETSTETAEVLPGATVVILAFAVGYPQLVLETYERADKYGIPIGEAETLGIGGGLMGLRHLKVGMPIMDLVKKVCPEAWCVVSTNPIRHLTDYANRYAGIRKSMGLCHGTKATLRYIEKCLEMEWGSLESIVVGANHLIWYLKIWERATGDDWYPKLAEILQERDLDGHMGRYLYSVFGLYPGNGPGHVPDGFGFFQKRLWEAGGGVSAGGAGGEHGGGGAAGDNAGEH